jgi:hypothetical protein
VQKDENKEPRSAPPKKEKIKKKICGEGNI